MSDVMSRILSKSSKLARKLGCPTPKYIRILCIDENKKEIESITNLLSQPGEITYKVESTEGYAAAIEEISKKNHDIYLINCELWSKKGVDLIKDCIDKKLQGPYIILCSSPDNEEFYRELAEINSIHTGINNISLIRNCVKKSYHEVDSIIRYAIKNYRIENSILKFEKAVEQKKKEYSLV